MPKASTLLLVLVLLFWSAANLLGETPAAPALQRTSPGSDEEPVKQLSNPISSLVSVPFQNNFDFGLGTGDGWRYSLNFQPVVPLRLNSHWNLIVRTIVPYIYQENLFRGLLDQVTLPDDIVENLKGRFGRVQQGLGDITQSFFPFTQRAGVGWDSLRIRTSVPFPQ
jgi:hypothetical protein